MKKILTELIEHRSLSKQAAKQVLIEIASNQFNNSQIASFMTVYMMRGITIDELEGFRDAMLELCIPVKIDAPVMDVCGTGGDGKNTFNISTLSSFIVAAAGQPVAKHGNYGVSSITGSSNILEYLGYQFPQSVDELKRSIDRANICFMHAPLFHPAMKIVAPIRKELGVKTFFNMLGPMVNPALPTSQLVGVFSLELARQYAYLYQQTKKSFTILYSLDGYDEISLTNAFKCFYNGGEMLIDPIDIGMNKLLPQNIKGGDTVKESAGIFMSILEGKGTDYQNDVVTANAGMAIFCANQTKSISEAIELARESLYSGKALRCFTKLVTN